MTSVIAGAYKIYVHGNVPKHFHKSHTKYFSSALWFNDIVYLEAVAVLSEDVQEADRTHFQTSLSFTLHYFFLFTAL